MCEANGNIGLLSEDFLGYSDGYTQTRAKAFRFLVRLVIPASCLLRDPQNQLQKLESGIYRKTTSVLHRVSYCKKISLTVRRTDSGITCDITVWNTAKSEGIRVVRE